MAKSREYWKKRFEKLEDDTYRKSKAYYDDLQEQFRRATSELEKDVSTWYYRVAENNEISYAQAKRYLNRKEVKEFRWTVDEYIKYGKENALDQKWMKELENASARVHITRLETVKLQLQQSVEKLFVEYEGGVSDLLNKAFKSSYYKSAFEIAKGTGVGKDLHALDDNLVSSFLRKPWAADGKDFSSRIWQDKEKLIRELHTELTQQLIRGSDPGKTIAALAKKMDVSKSKAGNLVMTETAAIHSMAQKECYKNLEIEEFQNVATLDLRTSDICIGMDGTHFPISEYKVNVTAPPFHCNCRTCTCPYFNDEFTEGEERAARDPVTGKTHNVPADMTYKEWHEKYVKGNPQADLAEKKSNNTLADQKQYDKYKSILGKDTPKNLDDFQNLKYTNDEKWNMLQLAYKDQKVRNNIRSDDTVKIIETGKQGKHIKGHNNYIEGRSYLTITEKETQDLVNKYAGTGEIKRDNRGNWNNKEVVDFKKEIGISIDNLTGIEYVTTKAKIHYSKKGVHVVPHGKE
ncbi:polymorphic toxin type 50 domain-containing protein [Lachnoclostridium phytofermentans]|uniref:Phage head morphogenesis protein, SPP1 gp7 family n=1 Tax=Lachnoclostridium phytofermentans (strain ATCC 700394 / DSM 18823 / ISDg) TaxID=357809 RepID=A9KQ14_LACP7|nr:polymorphic toxin type 50 domain-containing protein [Lachnoclostridium phytofermentans]ABX43326.1 phage head morphogenesis protein, SPP1 gp7 family [Lachnoclostridium phytofermentans ISDg]